MWDVKKGEVFRLSSQFLACVTGGMVVEFIKIGDNGGKPSLGAGKQVYSLSQNVSLRSF